MCCSSMCGRWWVYLVLSKNKKKRKEQFSEMENADTPHDAAANDVAKPPASGTVKKIITKKNKKVVTIDEGDLINKLLL
jgi:prolyl-tRNA synthetase